MYLLSWKISKGYFNRSGFLSDAECDYYEEQYSAWRASHRTPPPQAHIVWAREFGLKTVPGRPWETVGEWQVEPILELAERAGLRPRKRGKEYLVLCPAHNDSRPSCYLNPEKNCFICFSCNESGGSKKFKQLVGL